MPGLVLDGKALARQIEGELAERVAWLTAELGGRLPTLATILVGNDPASVTYVRMKGNACRRVGMDSVQVIPKLSLDEDNILFLLGKLNKIRLVQRKKEHYLGYRISRAGYDALALHDLAQKDVIVSLGQPYGVGKEATVYSSLDANERRLL